MIERSHGDPRQRLEKRLASVAVSVRRLQPTEKHEGALEGPKRISLRKFFKRIASGAPLVDAESDGTSFRIGRIELRHSAISLPGFLPRAAPRGGIYRYLGTYPTDAYLVGAFMTPLEHDTDPVDSRGRDYRASDHSFPRNGVAKVGIHAGELRAHWQMLPAAPDR